MSSFSVILTGGVGRTDVGKALCLMAEQGIVDASTLTLEKVDHIVVDGERIDIPATKYTAEVWPLSEDAEP